MRRLALRALAAAVAVAVALAILELGSAAAIRAGWIQASLPNRGRTGIWWGEHPQLGVWHVPRATGPVSGACFRSTYRINGAGARDRERPRRADGPRVVVLGDSFLEGWGVDEADRLSNRLERATGVPHLNFAMAHFGPYQQYLAYREVASGFDHTAVLASVLPVNDFYDLDLEASEALPDYEYRFRPYLMGAEPPFHHGEYREPRLRRLLRRHSHAYQALRAARRGRSAPQGGSPGRWFWEFSDRQLALLEASLSRLVEAARPRPVAVVLIPGQWDLERYQREGPSPLEQAMGEMAEALGFELLDLMPPMAERVRTPASYFHTCDYHWNRFGNQVAAELVRERLPADFYDPH